MSLTLAAVATSGTASRKLTMEILLDAWSFSSWRTRRARSLVASTSFEGYTKECDNRQGLNLRFPY